MILVRHGDAPWMPRFDALTCIRSAATSRSGLALLLSGGALARPGAVDAKKKLKLDDCGGCPTDQPVCCPYGCCPSDRSIFCGNSETVPCLRGNPL